MTQAYEIQQTTFDAARPWAVVTTLRTFNRVIARYADQEKARRYARDLNRMYQRAA